MKTNASLCLSIIVLFIFQLHCAKEESKKDLIKSCVRRVQIDHYEEIWNKTLYRDVARKCNEALHLLSESNATELILDEEDLQEIFPTKTEDNTMTPHKASWIFGSSVFIIFGFLGFTYIMKICCSTSDEINMEDIDPETLEALKNQPAPQFTRHKIHRHH